MDDSYRQQMIKNAAKAISSAEGLTESVKPVEHDKIYEYRNMLGKIHEFEKIIRVEDTEWTDEEWNKFESWIGKTKSNLSPELELIVKAEEARKKNAEISRQKILENVKKIKW